MSRKNSPSTALHAAINRVRRIAARLGLSISATKALELCTAISGYRSSNELSAIAAETDMNMPSLSPTGIILPTPCPALALALYESPEGHLMTAPARRHDQLQITPVGRPVILRPATDQTEISSVNDQASLTLTEDGQNWFYMAKNTKEAEKILLEILRENVSESDENTDKFFELQGREAINEYFENIRPNDSYDISPADLEQWKVEEITRAVEQLMTAKHFEVRQRFGSSEPENTWFTEDENGKSYPTTFTSFFEAQNQLKEFFSEINDAVENGDISTRCDKDEYHIFAVSNSGNAYNLGSGQNIL